MSLPARSDIPVDWTVYAQLCFFAFVIVLVVLLPSYVLNCVLVIVGIACMIWGGWINYLSAASKKWPVIQGVIIENGIGAIEVPGRWIGLIDYFPVIAYRYELYGVTYFSRRIALFPSDLRIQEDRTEHPPNKNTEDFCKKFPLNTAVSVHYDPRSPKDGLLIVGALSRSKQHSIVFFVLGSFLLFLGGFLFYVGY